MFFRKYFFLFMIKPFQTPIPVAKTILFNVGKHQMLKGGEGISDYLRPISRDEQLKQLFAKK